METAGLRIRGPRGTRRHTHPFRSTTDVTGGLCTSSSQVDRIADAPGDSVALWPRTNFREPQAINGDEPDAESRHFDHEPEVISRPWRKHVADSWDTTGSTSSLVEFGRFALRCRRSMRRWLAVSRDEVDGSRYQRVGFGAPENPGASSNAPREPRAGAQRAH